MGKYPLTPSEKARFDRMWMDLSAGRKATAIIDFEHFCSWLRGEDSSFYYAIKDKLRDLWDEIKSTAGDIAEGVATGVLGLAATPIVGLYEGVKEGLDNGLEAGIKKGFKAISDLWDDICS